MGFAEYANHDALGLAELLKKKEVKPAELVEAAIGKHADAAAPVVPVQRAHWHRAGT